MHFIQNNHVTATRQVLGRHHIMPAAGEPGTAAAAHRAPPLALGCCWGLPACLHTTPRDPPSCLAPGNEQLTGSCVLLGRAVVRWLEIEPAAINAELDTMVIKLFDDYGMWAQLLSSAHSAQTLLRWGVFLLLLCWLVRKGAQFRRYRMCYLLRKHSQLSLWHTHTHQGAATPRALQTLQGSGRPNAQAATPSLFLHNLPQPTPPHPIRPVSHPATPGPSSQLLPTTPKAAVAQPRQHRHTQTTTALRS